ncbi:MAG: hypothetical protein AVDCRST_MAG74-3835 [uncultured Pyrinomonadaceae bacterium]|uniref:Uncharacterized protein n=1 Tax=uncultured Pyrinomonadaceae bacterium TaxID=2283094 RepID=A0A6J4Q7L5_9BACT|nr:MAG: hypothetical protein AVDCRST_MAG74-3835 [uncultured Pyrinomonadaceae bacterium]
MAGIISGFISRLKLSRLTRMCQRVLTSLIAVVIEFYQILVFDFSHRFS